MNKQSAKITHLTPRIIKKAEEVINRQGEEEEEEESDEDDLEELSEQWTGHVQNLLEASQKANMPWSRSAKRLVTSAKTRRGLDKEVRRE